MTVHIQRMDSTLHVEGGREGADGRADVIVSLREADRTRLKELLRPIVLEIIDEAVRQSRRSRG